MKARLRTVRLSLSEPLRISRSTMAAREAVWFTVCELCVFHLFVNVRVVEAFKSFSSLAKKKLPVNLASALNPTWRISTAPWPWVAVA